MKGIISLIAVLLFFSGSVFAQNTGKSETETVDPKIAFLKSLAVPGWGHHYVDKTNWVRGQYHLAADAVLLLSYVGLTFHSNNLRQNWYTYARMEAGVDIEERGRNFRLAVGDFENLQAYNEYQERSRNWDELYEDAPANQWSWGSKVQREEYRDLRTRFESIDQQLPAVLSLMVVNRVVSAISAYNRAQKRRDGDMVSSLHFSPYRGIGGVVGHLRISF